MTSVLVVSSDHIGSSMAGTGIRYLWFARELGRRGYDVTLVVPFATDLTPYDFEVRIDNPWQSHRMTPLAKAHDVVVAQRLPVPTMLAVARSRTRAIYDLYAPLTIEHAALPRGRESVVQATANLSRLTDGVALETGDAFICASERQRDLWLGALEALGRITPDSYAQDPSFRSLLDVVPFGVDPSPPISKHPVLKGVMPGIACSDKVILWGGGIWDWLDPLTVIRAVHRLERSDLKLFFLGTRSPNAAVPAMKMEAQAFRLAAELGMLGRSIFVNEGWVPFEQRGAYLLEADIGVSAHRDELEARFAFRARLLDCIWAGLPIVTSMGDAVADLVEKRALGRVVGVGDVEGYAHGLSHVLHRGRAAFSASFDEVRPSLEWPHVIERLAQFVEKPKPQPRRKPARVVRTGEYAVLRTRLALAAHGVTGMAMRAVAGGRRRASGAAHPGAVGRALGETEDLPGERLP